MLAIYFDTLFIPRKLSPSVLQYIDSLLAYFQIQSFKHRPFNLLSLGEQRIVLFIRALIKNPVLLLLDEPYQGMDKTTIQMANNLLDEIFSAGASTLIFITHYARELPAVINRITRIESGRITEDRESQD